MTIFSHVAKYEKNNQLSKSPLGIHLDKIRAISLRVTNVDACAKYVPHLLICNPTLPLRNVLSVRLT